MLLFPLRFNCSLPYCILISVHCFEITGNTKVRESRVLVILKRNFENIFVPILTLSLSFRRSSVGTFIRQQPLTSSGSSSVDSSRGSKTSTTAPRLDYRSMVSVEDMPELFVSFDSKCPEELINFPELWNANIFQSVYFFGMIKSNERYIQCNRFSTHTKYLLSTFL